MLRKFGIDANDRRNLGVVVVLMSIVMMVLIDAPIVARVIAGTIFGTVSGLSFIVVTALLDWM